MTVWLSRPLAVALHDRQLAEHGGLPGVRDENLLAAALARPQQLEAYADPPADLALLAASLAQGLAKNHAFVDGNKRTAAVACETFLELNGSKLMAGDADFYFAVMALATSRMSLEEFAGWLRENLHAARQIREPSPRYRVRRPTAKKKKNKKP